MNQTVSYRDRDLIRKGLSEHRILLPYSHVMLKVYLALRNLHIHSTQAR